MAGTAPIKLGSASGTAWTFESGSDVSTDQYGIQTCNVRALFGDGSSVYTNMPAEGISFASVFGNSYLPSSFLLDFFEGAPSVEYQDATVARVTFKFKRQDPTWGSRRTISVDSVLNYQNNVLSQILLLTSGVFQQNVFGFPEPTVTVKYSSTTQPGIGAGGLSSIYAMPGSAKAQGFPDAPAIGIPFPIPVSPGTAISYWNGSAFVSFTATASTTFNFVLNFIANPRGWQLTKLKSDPVANRNFWAVEEDWRNFYSCSGASFVGHTP